MSGGQGRRTVADWFERFGFDWPGRPGLVFSRTVARRPDAVHTSRALRRLLEILRSVSHADILDVGPMCGTNVSFLGDALGCRLVVADLYAELDRAMRQGGPEALAQAVEATVSQPGASLDAVLCWDAFDYLPPRAAGTLAGALARVLRPGGVAFGLCSTILFEAAQCTRFAIQDEAHIHYRPYACALTQERTWLSRDFARMCAPLYVEETYLQSHGMREVILRKRAW